jgi:hypothetical protein
MALLFSGKLVSSAQDPPPFTGCRVEALYEFRAPAVQTATAPGSLTDDLSLAAHHARVSEALERGDLVEAGAVPAPTAVAPPPEPPPAAPAPGRASALCDAEGHFVLSLPDRKDITSEKVRFLAFSPLGRAIGEKELVAATLSDSTSIDVLKFGPTVLDPPEPTVSTVRRIRGRVIERNGRQLPTGLQVLLLASETADGPSTDEETFSPILVAKADSSGYFAGDVPSTKFHRVAGLVGGIPGEHVVRLEDSLVPLSVPIVVELPEGPETAAKDDCDCSTSAIPHTPTQENIADTPGVFSADLGTGQCIRFNVPNRAIEEFNFYSVVRTTEPDIVGLTTGTGGNGSGSGRATRVLLDAPATEETVAPGRAMIRGEEAAPEGNGDTGTRTLALATRADDGGARDRYELELARSRVRVDDELRLYAHPPDIYTQRGVQRPPGRVPLDGRAPVDWDSTPTFYEAASIAHGHLLHYKQVWYADGYSLGDLLYSLPLAPGQKKLISVVDWERREQASRDELTSAGESLDSTLTRDRDLSEVVSATLSESARGGSRNTTTGVGVGTGAAGNGSYQQFNFGALLGVSGGVGESDSSAFQDSSRNLSGSSLQTLRDRTLQASAAVRNLRSTIVQTARQGEAVRATTEVVANHNHCHALTIQYFEVLRHFKVGHELADVQECLFVPLPMTEFDRPKVLRWRQSLSPYLQRPELGAAFDATRRVETLWSEVDTPQGRYADETVTAIFGELTLTIIIPLPPFPEKPKPKPEDTAADTAAAVGKALSPTEGFFGAVLAIATGGASLIAGAATSAATDAVKATTQGARALAESLLDEPSAEERYARFQQEVMPSAAVGFVDELELYALVGANEVKLSGADFTLVSNYQPGTPLLVSVRGHLTTPVRRGDISAIVIKSAAPLPSGCRAIVNSASLRYQTTLFRHGLVTDDRVNDDIDLPVVAYTGLPETPTPPLLPPGFPTDWVPVPGMTPLRAGNGAILYTPLDEWEQRSPRLEDIRLSAELVEHLNAHLEYYHHAVWWTMDPNRRFMLLDGYSAPNAGGRSVASVVDNTLIGIVGNSLVMPVARGNKLDPQFKLAEGVTLLEHYEPQSPVPPSRVSLPTRGVFAEAVMGDCNACEEIDDTRFWRWEESPIDEPPALDATAIASRRAEPAYGTPTPFPNPLVSIQNAPQAPDPTGLQQALETVAQQSFADITGLAGTQANAAMAYSKALDTAYQFGKEASTLAQQAAMTKNIGQTMREIDKAESGDKINKDDAKQLRTSALKTMAGDRATDPKAASMADRLKVLDDQESKGGITPDQAMDRRVDILKGLEPEDATNLQESTAGVEAIDRIPGDAIQSVKAGDVEVLATGGLTGTGAKTEKPSGLGDSSGQASKKTEQLWSGAEELLNAAADGLANWKDSPSKELSDAIKESIEEAVLAAADDATDKIPLVKAFKVGVQLSLAFADGVGGALEQTNDELRRTYRPAELVGGGSDGLSDADVEALQSIRRWQLTNVQRVNGILEAGVEAVVEKALSMALKWLTGTAVKAASGVAKQLVGEYLKQSGTEAVLADALDELRKKVPLERTAFYKKTLTLVIGLYVRQLDDPDLRKDLKPLTKLDPDKPVEKMILSTLAALLVDPVAGKVDAGLRATITARAKKLVAELRADGQDVVAGQGQTISASNKRVTLPQSVLTEIEHGPAAAEAEAARMFGDFVLDFTQMRDGTRTAARTLGLMRLRGLTTALRNDDQDQVAAIYNPYVDDLKRIGFAFYRSARARIETMSGPAKQNALNWLAGGVTFQRLAFEWGQPQPPRWELVAYVYDEEKRTEALQRVEST